MGKSCRVKRRTKVGKKRRGFCANIIVNVNNDENATPTSVNIDVNMDISVTDSVSSCSIISIILQSQRKK